MINILIKHFINLYIMLNAQAPLAVADSEREVSYDTKTNKDINHQTMSHHTIPMASWPPRWWVT